MTRKQLNARPSRERLLLRNHHFGRRSIDSQADFETPPAPADLAHDHARPIYFTSPRTRSPPNLCERPRLLRGAPDSGRGGDPLRGRSRAPARVVAIRRLLPGDRLDPERVRGEPTGQAHTRPCLEPGHPERLSPGHLE